MIIEKVKICRFPDMIKARAAALVLIDEDYLCHFEIKGSHILLHIFKEGW